MKPSLPLVAAGVLLVASTASAGRVKSTQVEASS